MPKVEIYITRSPQTPTLPVNLGGRGTTIPVGRNTLVDDLFLPVLDNCPEIEYRRVGETFANADAQAPSEAFVADAIIDGNVGDVIARLAALTPEQLIAVREAEEDREVSRKGVISAVNKAITALN